MKVLISDPLSEIGLTLLKNSGFECIYRPKSDNAELESIIKVIDAWIIRSGTKIDYNLIKVSKNLKAIGRAGVGVDNINLDAATRTVTFYKNGVADSQGPQNLPTNMQTGFIFGVAMVLDSSIIHLNTGNGFFGTTAISSAGSNGNGSLFEYSVPSGYYALNTKNINTYG